MKATVEVSSSNCYMKKTNNKINKFTKRDRDETSDEMRQLLYKLKELVPNMPKNRSLSMLAIIQHVIDYILDLQIALETHPAVWLASYGITTRPSRQPLGLLPHSCNNVVVNSCTIEETEKTPSHLGTDPTRSVMS
ncbi:protein extra-macrochaetae-like [Limulus polyphemus]|uniref:Protein extra-macrochaetae-like n=1 Tax=Limulus polyphemus TaxID=6850 RepID=A0ABM1SI68_LIMPO|nr:protein extra-macrochaetae-like [Limulus polyphemus]